MRIQDKDVINVLLAVEEHGANAKAALMEQGYDDDQVDCFAYQLGHLEKMFMASGSTTLSSGQGRAFFGAPSGLLPNGRARLDKHRQRFTAVRVTAAASIITAIAVIVVPLILRFWQQWHIIP